MSDPQSGGEACGSFPCVTCHLCHSLACRYFPWCPYALGCASAPSEHCGMSVYKEPMSFRSNQTSCHGNFSVLRFPCLVCFASDSLFAYDSKKMDGKFPCPVPRRVGRVFLCLVHGRSHSCDSGLMQVAPFPLSTEMGSAPHVPSWMSRPQCGVLSHTTPPGSLSSAPAPGSDMSSLFVLGT